MVLRRCDMDNRTRRFKRRDHCPQCGDIDFLCTEYISDNQIYLYEEQCPRCYDFWQINLDDDCRKFLSNKLVR